MTIEEVFEEATSLEYELDSHIKDIFTFKCGCSIVWAYPDAKGNYDLYSASGSKKSIYNKETKHFQYLP